MYYCIYWNPRLSSLWPQTSWREKKALSWIRVLVQSRWWLPSSFSPRLRDKAGAAYSTAYSRLGVGWEGSCNEEGVYRKRNIGKTMSLGSTPGRPTYTACKVCGGTPCHLSPPHTYLLFWALQPRSRWAQRCCHWCCLSGHGTVRLGTLPLTTLKPEQNIAAESKWQSLGKHGEQGRRNGVTGDRG